MMRAFRLAKPRPVEEFPLELAECEIPQPADGEILVRVSACAVCRTDLHVCEGDLETRRPRVVPGHQIVGRVAGAGTGRFGIGQRVGVAWLGGTCGSCGFCRSGRENLCDAAEFTGWTRDGGFAGYATVLESFAYELPDAFADTEAAPLLCAGIIGHRALGFCADPGGWQGLRLGIFGFGAAGHIAIQLARFRGAEVFVATRDRERHQALAFELGAAWVGDTFDMPPRPLDAAIVFAPAGEIVPHALQTLTKGGRLVLGGIHMSPIPEFPYSLLYGERSVRSVANNTRTDGREFLAEAALAGVRTKTEIFEFEALPQVLIALKHDAIKGSAVIRMDQ